MVVGLTDHIYTYISIYMTATKATYIAFFIHLEMILILLQKKNISYSPHAYDVCMHACMYV